MSDFKSPFDRDMFHADRMGAEAVKIEVKQPGIWAGSHKIRNDFRKGILDRYPLGSDKRESLNAAYYNQPLMLTLINAEPGFDGPDEVVVSGEEFSPEVMELLNA